jgi:hypothetical protein
MLTLLLHKYTIPRKVCKLQLKSENRTRSNWTNMLIITECSRSFLAVVISETTGSFQMVTPLLTSVYTAARTLLNLSDLTQSLVLRVVLCWVRSQPLLKPQEETCGMVATIFVFNKSLVLSTPSNSHFSTRRQPNTVVLKLFQTTAHLAKCTRPQRPPKLSHINL